jgi:FKBP-type peptidyl-prolyl cis-trans isomerase FkpA
LSPAIHPSCRPSSARLRRLALSAFALAAGVASAQAPAPAGPAAGSKADIVTASGLTYTSLREGSGPQPTADDIVSVNYRGTFMNGDEFDSSYKRGKAAEFPLSRVIRCWTEGLQMMKVGGKAHLVCPGPLAYGERGRPGTIPPNTTLQFDVELLAIVKPKSY